MLYPFGERGIIVRKKQLNDAKFSSFRPSQKDDQATEVDKEIVPKMECVMDKNLHDSGRVKIALYSDGGQFNLLTSYPCDFSCKRC